jgi:cytochrome b involved in lipid metabolism
MKKAILLGLVLITMLIAACTSAPKDEVSEGSVPEDVPQQTDTGSVEETNNESTENTEITTVSSVELALHNSEDDCWVSYEEEVYDITEFLPNHPDTGAGIIPYCGTSSEFENAFTTKHGTSKIKVLLEEGTYKGTLE